MLGEPGNAWTLALHKKVETNNDPLTGRNRKAYWSYEQYPQSSSGPFSESTPAFASANAEEAVELQMVPADMQRTIGLSLQKKQQLERMDSKRKELSMAKLVSGAIAAEKRKMVKQFEGGRGDNVGARAFAAGAGSTQFKCDPGVPILFQRGDEVLAYKADAGDAAGERNRGQADTGTLYMGATSRRIVNIKRDGDTPEMTLSSAASWSDDAVLVWKSNPTLDAPYGLPDMLDNVNDGTFQWDFDDSTSCDHRDVYHGGTRSSNNDLDCWVYNAGTAELDLALFSTGMALSIDGNEGDPTVANDLVVFMNPRQWRRFVKQSMGAVRLTTKTLFLPGSSTRKYTVPMLTGQGVQEVMIRTTYNIPDGFVSYVDHKKLRKVQTEASFLPGTDGIWHLLNQASASGYQAQYEAYLVYTLQHGLFLPRSSGNIYSLDTSDSV
jgi:hypothetical protein